MHTPFMNYKFKQVLAALTHKHYSPETYQLSELFGSEGSEVIVTRCDNGKMALNPEISAVIQGVPYTSSPSVPHPASAQMPYGIAIQRNFPCSALGFSLDMCSGCVRVAVYAIREESNSICFHVDMIRRYSSDEYAYIKTKDIELERVDDDDWLPAPTSRFRGKRRGSPIICRIEGRAIGYDLLSGKEGVDWTTHHRRNGEDDGSFLDFWPLEDGYTPEEDDDDRRQLALRRDLSSLHCDLKREFEFDLLSVGESAIEITVNARNGQPKKVYKLKVGSYELVRGQTTSPSVK